MKIKRGAQYGEQTEKRCNRAVKNSIGAAGEERVAEYLLGRGYTVAARNYHSRFGEIDIIVENSEYICFVEVKTRKAGGLENPLEAITRGKRRKLILTAGDYLSKNKTVLQLRFDAAAVTHENGVMRIEYIENAFMAEGYR